MYRRSPSPRAGKCRSRVHVTRARRRGLSCRILVGSAFTELPYGKKTRRRRVGSLERFRTNGTGINSLLLLYIVSTCNGNLFINIL